MGRILTDPVEAYAGCGYPERPLALEWEDEHLIVARIISRWRSPGGPGFRVRVADGRNFELTYNEKSNQWSILLLPS